MRSRYRRCRTMNEIPAEQTYFIETAWESIRSAYRCKTQGRLAMAQQYLLEARYFEAKIHPKFIDAALNENIDRIGKIISRGY